MSDVYILQNKDVIANASIYPHQYDWKVKNLELMCELVGVRYDYSIIEKDFHNNGYDLLGSRIEYLTFILYEKLKEMGFDVSLYINGRYPLVYSITYHCEKYNLCLSMYNRLKNLLSNKGYENIENIDISRLHKNLDLNDVR